MARGKKTGGSDFQSGNPGRPKGAKDKVPRGSIKTLYAEILATDRQAVQAALRKKLLQGDFSHVKLAAEYVDGKPMARIQIEEPQPINFIIQMANGTEKQLDLSGGAEAIKAALSEERR